MTKNEKKTIKQGDMKIYTYDLFGICQQKLWFI